MPITTVTWLMIMALIGTDILISLLDKYFKDNSDV